MSALDPRFHVEHALNYLQEGRRMFSRLVERSGGDLVVSVYAMTDEELRAIVLDRVVAAQAAQRLGQE